ncbi:cytochrome P450 71A1-like [Gossypium hirsutum]|uniref:Cytochrome P450 71A1-like n=1 Tax=Gossypium hirsutum TaxID=3635 RepID=A0ABM2YVL1_GOSHI|nr:cytochrome P450 71A1-like [Gossypium hirsutum]
MACAPYGDYWRQVKKMSFVQHFSNQSVQSFQFIRDEEVELLINKIRSVCLKGESIYLIDMLMSVSSNIVSRCVLSHKSEEDGRSKLGELGKRLLILFNSLCVGDMFPYLRWVDVLTGLIPSMKAVSAELDAFLDQVIQEHKALESYVKKNFLSIIMQLQKNGTFEMDLAQENIKAYWLFNGE